MVTFKRVTVFCGSNAGVRPAYAQAAVAMGQALVDRGIELVFGGGKIGLMGIIADAVLQGGGKVIGVMPRALAQREIAHLGLTELRLVDSMHERKAVMAQLSQAFIALPGGMGTYEEFFEAVTWSQLGLHRKACGLLDVDGFYSPLANFIDRSGGRGFHSPRASEHRGDGQRPNTVA